MDRTLSKIWFSEMTCHWFDSGFGGINKGYFFQTHISNTYASEAGHLAAPTFGFLNKLKSFIVTQFYIFQ